MDGIRDDFRWEPKITKPLKVIVVGAGMAGLTAAIGEKRRPLLRWEAACVDASQGSIRLVTT
jgi:2-polyprenyl-6-methoxyphenol hydroxylase-like FAD-dependent oxidoreductase